MGWPSFVPRFFAQHVEKKLGRELGNEARLAHKTSSVQKITRCRRSGLEAEDHST